MSQSPLWVYSLIFHYKWPTDIMKLWQKYANRSIQLKLIYCALQFIDCLVNLNGFGQKINSKETYWQKNLHLCWAQYLSVHLSIMSSFCLSLHLRAYQLPVAVLMLMLRFLSALIRLYSVIAFSLSMAHFLFEPLVSVAMRWSMSVQRFCVQYFCLKSVKVLWCCCSCLIFKKKIGLL